MWNKKIILIINTKIIYFKFFIINIGVMSKFYLSRNEKN